VTKSVCGGEMESILRGVDLTTLQIGEDIPD